MNIRHHTMHLSASGPAAPSRAWRRYERPELWTTWAPHITSARASADVISPGVTGHLTAMGVIPARFRVDEVDPEAMSWAWWVTTGPITLRLKHSVAALPGGGSVTALTITGPWIVVHSYAWVARIALTRLVAADTTNHECGAAPAEP